MKLRFVGALLALGLLSGQAQAVTQSLSLGQFTVAFGQENDPLSFNVQDGLSASAIIVGFTHPLFTSRANISSPLREIYSVSLSLSSSSLPRPETTSSPARDSARIQDLLLAA